VNENSWVTYGADTSTSRGVALTPGNGIFGAWTEIGTTSQNHNLWVVAMSLGSNTAVGSSEDLIEIGVGPNSGAVASMGFTHATWLSTEQFRGCGGPVIPYPTTSGDKVWCRVASGETTGRSIVMYGGG
jgi:hypothetical protein